MGWVLWVLVEHFCLHYNKTHTLRRILCSLYFCLGETIQQPTGKVGEGSNRKRGKGFKGLKLKAATVVHSTVVLSWFSSRKSYSRLYFRSLHLSKDFVMHS